jgi:glyoxylase-like metal-dependent hydrolase (beta-lactamase superfamily II)
LCGALSLGGLALAPFPRAWTAGEPTVARVTDGLALVTGAGGNVLALSTDDGLVVVDSGNRDSTHALIAALRALPNGDRIHTLFNTHWHLDQVGGNQALGDMGTAIVAHEKTRLHLSTDYYVPHEDRYERARPPAAQPKESFYTTREKTLGGERIEYGHLLEAHTDGDIYVFVRGANVVAAGDAISPERDPELDWFGGGWLGGRVDSLQLLLGLGNEDTRFVPSYGPVVGRAEVMAEHDLMLTVFERMVELVRKGLSAEDCVAAGAVDGLSRTFADPLKFVDAVHRGLWAHHNTLSPDIV